MALQLYTDTELPKTKEYVQTIGKHIEIAQITISLNAVATYQKRTHTISPITFAIGQLTIYLSGLNQLRLKTCVPPN